MAGPVSSPQAHHEQHYAVGQQSDYETDDRVAEHGFGFGDLFFVAAGRHPQKTGVKKDADQHNAHQAERSPDDVGDDDTDIGGR